MKVNGKAALGYWLTAAASVAMLAVYALYGTFPDAVALFTDYATPLVSGTAALLGVLAARRYSTTLRSKFAKAWLLFALGMTAWFVAELIWAVYVLALNVAIPYPSVADLFYVAGYVFFAGGLLLYVGFFSSAITRKKLMVTSAVIVVGTVLVAIFLVSPVIASNSGFLATIMDILYPVLDLLILGCAILGLTIFVGGKLGRAWLLLIAAILLDEVADVVFSYMDAQGTYFSGSISDFLYLWSYALFALAFYVHRSEL
jgi:hypothetical protein